MATLHGPLHAEPQSPLRGATLVRAADVAAQFRQSLHLACRERAHSQPASCCCSPRRRAPPHETSASTGRQLHTTTQFCATAITPPPKKTSAPPPCRFRWAVAAATQPERATGGGRLPTSRNGCRASVASKPTAASRRGATAAPAIAAAVVGPRSYPSPAAVLHGGDPRLLRRMVRGGRTGGVPAADARRRMTAGRATRTATRARAT